jgi:hypothetical protein
MRGLQQAELVVEPQLPPRDLCDLGKFTDAKYSGAASPLVRDVPLYRFDGTSKSSGFFAPLGGLLNGPNPRGALPDGQNRTNIKPVMYASASTGGLQTFYTRPLVVLGP